MRSGKRRRAITPLRACRATATLLALAPLACAAEPEADPPARALEIDPGPRAFALLDQLRPGPLRERLEACRSGPFRPSRFSIGHRGAPRHYPEHTRESYVAAARLGAGVLECDVTFTADRALVCRHSQCDLATTTNILATPLAATCRAPFRPAAIDESTGEVTRPASARCCTSELTLAQFRTLRGRPDRVAPDATTVEAYLAPTLPRLDGARDPGADAGTLLTHAESVALFDALGVAMTPELKAPEVEMPVAGTNGAVDYDQRAYAAAMIEDYRRAGISPARVWPQSFDPNDLAIWREVAPRYAERAVWLDGRAPSEPAPTKADFDALRAQGLRFLAPPLSRLLVANATGEIVASAYARRARAAGLELIAWTLERSGPISPGRVGGRDRDFYLSPVLPALENDGDVYRIVDALHREVGVRAIFSDWPAAPTFYANCFGLD